MSFLSLIPIVKDIINRVIPDKNAAQEAVIELDLMHAAGELSREEKRYDAIIMEAQSKDPWTSRARPSFLYVMYIFILTAFPMGLFALYSPEGAKALTEAMNAYLASIPTPMWTLFGAGYLGDVKKRSDDKANILGVATKLF